MADLSNLIWATTANIAPHLLSALLDTPMDPEDNAYAGIVSANLDASITTRLPPIVNVALLRYSNVYVNSFIALMQGGPSDQRRVCNHVFHTIYNFFQPNAPVKYTSQDPKLLKKLKKEDGAWTSRKRVMGCIMDTLGLTISLST